MSEFRKGLLASTALVIISASAALANGNEAGVEQTGNGNTAAIDQNGGSDNKFARTGGAGAATQTGDNNDIDVLQAGSRNQIGLAGGVSQQDDGNVLDVEQLTDDNVIGSVEQNSSSWSIFYNSGINTATVVQEGGDGNGISSIYQRARFAGSNTATVTQNGSGNQVDRVFQDNTWYGNRDNSITATFTGDNNGTSALTGHAATAAGAYSSDLYQSGSRNVIDLTVSGNSNDFGVAQIGHRNTLNAQNVTGSDNELGILQDSRTASFFEGNNLTIDAIIGDRNNIGAYQYDDNEGSIALLGASSNDNQILLWQYGENEADITIVNGDRNDVTVTQNGYAWNDPANDASVTVNGSDNLINASQNKTSYFASQNTMTVNVVGDGNNTTTAFSGDALAVGLTKGDLIQTGNGNLMTLDVFSSDNAFAASQLGNNNSVDGTIQGGNGNQVAVLQTGNGNNAYFVQNGAGNNIGVTQ